MPPIGRRGFVAGVTLATLGLGGRAAADAPGGGGGGPGGGGAGPDRGGGGPGRGGAGGGPGRGGAGGGRNAPAFRGMWVATVTNRDFPSRPGLKAAEQRAELVALLDLAVRRGMTAVVLQIRPSADALWPSPYEPWAACLTGVQGRDPGWDPLGTAVTEAHARGLELHAWCNPYRVASHTDPDRLAPGHPVRRHPEWALTYNGRMLYNPGLPEVRSHVQDAMLDAVRRYDVDALHWDDYFYPYPVAGEVIDDDAAFREHGDGFADRAAWRRNNIDVLVSETAARIKELKPGVAFGISPFGVWRDAADDPAGSDTRAGLSTYDDLYADTRRWIRERWIDYVVPQLYWNIGFAATDYAKLVPWWAETVQDTGVRLYLGEALYKVGDPAQPDAWQDPRELARHVALARKYPAVGGHCYFAAREVAEDPLGALTTALAESP
ncbi:glycoside hydrolase family 10 protein [Streptomyces sp. NPDC053431]|uniref:glycoside hydrolase family 10 protein n=1 Tax=Streptomyces sp. NPDC053431 TaxID=3365703 RepID=UPI0037CE202B